MIGQVFARRHFFTFCGIKEPNFGERNWPGKQSREGLYSTTYRAPAGGMYFSVPRVVIHVHICAIIYDWVEANSRLQVVADQ